MRDPGASDVLMCGRTDNPASTAFLASSPAASITLGLLVFVQDVMAAISTSPLRIDSPLAVAKERFSFSFGWLKPFSPTGLLNSSENERFTCPISIRSCGRFGPGRDGVTDARHS